MRHDLFIAGFGGQGVLLAGNLISYAALRDGLNVSFFPAYGVEKRGGAAMCTVVIADGDTGSPVVGHPSVSILLNQLSFDKYAPQSKPGGVCIVNSSLVDTSSIHRDDIGLISIPMNDIALSLGDPRLVNMVAAGAYVERSRSVTMESLKHALSDALPERNHRFIPANVMALEAGSARVRECR